MTKIKAGAIIFDFDGVIADTGEDIAYAIQSTQKKFGIPQMDRDEIISFVGNGMGNLIRNVFKGSSEQVISEALPYYREFYFRNCVKYTKLYKNTLSVLKHFKAREKGIVSNKPESITKAIMEKLGISSDFGIVIGPESAGSLKPEPEGILKALAHLKAEPGKSLMVGDACTDIFAGKKAGTFTCGITSGFGDTDALIKAGPDLIIDDIGELITKVE